MHEYSIASRIVETVKGNIKKEQAIRVKEVHLRKGELRILSEEALASAYRILTEGGELAGSKLVIQEVKTIVHCKECDYEGGVDYHQDLEYHFTVPILECPKCGSLAEITKGKELDLVQVVVEDQSGGQKNNS